MRMVFGCSLERCAQIFLVSFKLGLRGEDFDLLTHGCMSARAIRGG